MRRLSAARRVALGLVVAAGAVAVWPGHGADALAPRKVGYWVQAQSGSLPTPLPTPPVVPAGGLYVANGPDGPKAVSAIAYEVEPDVSGLLVLHVHSMATGLPPSPLAGTPAQPPAPDPVLAHLSACVVQGDWAAPDGAGVWEARPAFDPAQCVIGQFSTDGATVTFPLGAERQAGPGEFNLTIVPNPALTGTDNTPFSVTFEPPLEESMMPGEAAGSDSGEEPVFQPPTTEVEPPPADVPFDSGTAFGPTTDFSLPSVPTPTSVVRRPRPPRVNLPPQAAVPAVAVPDGRGERIMAVLLLMALAVGWWWVGGQQARGPHLLGSLAAEGPSAGSGSGSAGSASGSASGSSRRGRGAEPNGGIGRFARPRKGRARPLI